MATILQKRELGLFLFDGMKINPYERARRVCREAKETARYKPGYSVEWRPSESKGTFGGFIDIYGELQGDDLLQVVNRVYVAPDGDTILQIAKLVFRVGEDPETAEPIKVYLLWARRSA